MANLRYWYAFIYSQRFWQYFMMDLFGALTSDAFYRDWRRSALGWVSNLISCITSLVVGVAYAKLGFRCMFTILMLVNISIGIISIVLQALDPSPDGGDYHVA